MGSVSTELTASARKIEGAMRKQLAEIGQVRMADALDVNESTISRWKDNDIERIALQLAALGLKVVPESANVVTSQEAEAMRVLSIRALQGMGAAS